MSNLTIEINKQKYKLEKSFLFSGGEVQIKLPDVMETPKPTTKICIKTKLNSTQSIMELLLTHDALDRKFPNEKFSLSVDYFPYTRQDRVCVPGEAFSLEVMCNLINGLGFETVFISDVHSEVTKDLLYNVVNREQWRYVTDIVDEFNIPINDLLLVSPDKGALSKMKQIAKWYHKTPVNAYKVRCPHSGDIIETKIDVEDFGGTDIFIADDICDGGRTFVELAKVLKSKNCGKIYLYVTHGIFSKGLKDLIEAGIEHIYTTDSICEYESDDYISVHKIT